MLLSKYQVLFLSCSEQMLSQLKTVTVFYALCLQGLLGQSQSDSFTPDITPLMLAAHRDNYEIIKILLERGDRIPKPHNVQCPCKECIAYSNDDILCHSR